MNEFQIAILIAAIGTAIASRHIPHAVMWICLGAVNAVICDLYYASGLAYPAAITLLCDAMMCIAIDWCAREKWELRLFQVFQFSVLLSVFRLLEVVLQNEAYIFVPSHETYVFWLEICNWAALVLIAGTAFLERLRADDDGYYFRRPWRGYIRDAYSALRGARQTSHWRKN